MKKYIQKYNETIQTYFKSITQMKLIVSFCWYNDYSRNDINPSTQIKFQKIKHTEAVTIMFYEKSVIEISQNSQENTCARVSFLIKLQVLACNLIKKETLAQVFSCEFCKMFKNNFFLRTPPWLLLSFSVSVYCQKGFFNFCAYTC